MKLRLKDSFGMVPVGTKAAALSLKGTKIIAQGKAQSRHPGNISPIDSDPEGVEQTPATDVAPLQGANDPDVFPGFHPGLLSSSPSATGGVYRVIGQPEDLDGAKELAEKDKYGFQWWILPLIGAKAFGSEAGSKVGKKGADGGIDGMLVFTDDTSGKAKKVIVSVKGGHNVNVAQIRDLGHVIERENAAIGVYLTLDPPTKPMQKEADEKGFYHSPGWNKDYPRLQILTVEDILNGKQVDLPPNMQTFKQAGKVVSENKDQGMLGFE